MTVAAPERRRPAWDEVQERIRRDQARADAEHDAAVAASPVRPADMWRVCGEPLTDAPDRGCLCSPRGPFANQVAPALARLAAARTETGGSS